MLRQIKIKGKQALPQHVAEIRLNDYDSHDIFEHSIISRFNFTNGAVKKIDSHMESQVDQVIIGHDFFKRLCEANAKDLSLLPLPFPTMDKTMTHTKILQSTKLRSEWKKQQ